MVYRAYSPYTIDCDHYRIWLIWLFFWFIEFLRMVFEARWLQKRPRRLQDLNCLAVDLKHIFWNSKGSQYHYSTYIRPKARAGTTLRLKFWPYSDMDPLSRLRGQTQMGSSQKTRYPMGPCRYLVYIWALK